MLDRLRKDLDDKAWSRFVELYTPMLFAWAMRLGESDADASDLIQEVFVVLVQTLPQFEYDQTRTFRGWLRTLFMNKLRDRKRREGRFHKARDKVAAHAELPDDADAFWQREYQRELAGQALLLMQAEFAATTWKACWQTVVEERTAADVGRELGMSESAVYVAKCRVLRRLRRELQDLFD